MTTWIARTYIVGDGDVPGSPLEPQEGGSIAVVLARVGFAITKAKDKGRLKDLRQIDIHLSEKKEPTLVR